MVTAMTMRYNVVDPRDFFERTANLEMRDNPAMQRFLAALPERARICDAGCGSGRDAAHFAALGHDVLAFDAHPELVRLARERLGVPAMRMTFRDVDFEARFDAIWACASLLHLAPAELADALEQLARALTPGGLLYASVTSPLPKGRGFWLTD